MIDYHPDCMENKIGFLQFRELLQSLENSDTSIRLRMSGESWIAFSKLILVSENAMILQDGPHRKMIMNVRSVVEFEIDKPFSGYDANIPYAISH